MATEHILTPHRDELPSERIMPPPPEPGTEDATVLASLNEVYGGEPDPEDELVVEGIRRAMGRVLEREL